MKKNKVTISNPEELEKNLQYTSPATWITLSIVVCLIVSLLVWSFVYKIKEKVCGMATIESGEVTLVVDSKVKSKLTVGQKVYIEELEGEIISFVDNEPVVSEFTLADGEYVYTVFIDVRPIEYLIR